MLAIPNRPAVKLSLWVSVCRSHAQLALPLLAECVTYASELLARPMVALLRGRAVGAPMLMAKSQLEGWRFS